MPRKDEAVRGPRGRQREVGVVVLGAEVVAVEAGDGAGDVDEARVRGERGRRAGSERGGDGGDGKAAKHGGGSFSPRVAPAVLRARP
jgi:hypothetical protein